MSQLTPRVPLIWGTMNMGYAGKSGVRMSDRHECQEILDTFFKYGNELDTARAYGDGTTEQFLAELDLKDATIDTKVYPDNPGDHAPEALRSAFLTSLRSLNRPKARVFYLHAPDRSVAFEDTLREVNELYKEGLFEILGLSNFAAWEAAEVITICKSNGWVQPKIYQVMYNAITREMEPELLPCCRKFGLRIVVYNPLAGGFFAGKVTSLSDCIEGRFDPNSGDMGVLYRARYLNDGYFEALRLLKEVADKHSLRLTEIALRWLQHHSALTPTDGIVIGASSKAQLEQNGEDCLKGPLDEDVVKALDEARRIVVAHGGAPSYWR